jgi:hypothetical protein
MPENEEPTEVALSWRDIKDVLDHDSGDELGALIDLAFGKFVDQIAAMPGEYTVVLSAKLVRITS